MEVADADTFHVVALGAPTSGKTVYLAALNHILGEVAQALGPSVTATVDDHEKRAFLAKTYNLAVKPDDMRWPPGTDTEKPMREFIFSIRVSWTQARFFGGTRRRTYTALNVSYVDYAGDYIPEGDEQPAKLLQEFKECVRKAHALLGVIDGLKLLQFMQGHQLGESFMNDHMRQIIAFMESADKPVHFIVTKWDLLSSRGFTLEAVRQRLLESAEAGFTRLVMSRTAIRPINRRPQGTIRLIPVTAVGDLAVLTDNWEVVKNGKAKAAQENVEIPLIAAVYDICDLASEYLRRSQRGDSGADNEINLVGAGVEQTAKTTAPLIDNRGHDIRFGPDGLSVSLRHIIAFAADGGKDVVKALALPTRWATLSLRSSIRRVRARGIRGVTSQEAALYYATRELKRRLGEFEEKYPQSLLEA